ncbi:Signal transduction histidine kinase (modular protein) [Burkholderiales bacterium 8X]|nr:Signal transduction histidine kinase (modular protein) [Burkholderiales bacterium 8X]
MRGRTLVIATVTAVALLFFWASSALRDLDEELMQSSGPHEGYYWTVAQYELAFLRVREAIMVMTLGGDPGDDELARRGGVLMSKSLILTGKSELTSYFNKIPGYRASAEKVAAFHRHVDPMLDTPATMRANLGELMKDLQAVEDTILALGNEVRFEEMQERQTTVETLQTRRQLIWLGLWAGLAVLLLWVLSISIYWSRYIKEARARDQALDAERRAVQLNTRFLGMVGHELRSPLQSIVSALDLFESRQASLDQAQVSRQVRRAANQLNLQLVDLLTLSRGQTGRIELHPEVFEACELVREVVDAQQEAARAKDLRLSVHTPAEPVFVVADGGRIAQVLNNLVVNTVSYTPAGGSAEVSLLAFDAATERLEFRVVDTGLDLPSEALRTLTDGFEAPVVESTRRRRGLGLALVHTLLRQLGGTARVEAVEPVGKAILVAVPVVPADERPSMPAAGSNRVLLVEPVPEGREKRGHVPSSSAFAGFEFDRAASPAMALNHVAARGYPTIVFDLDMPGLAAEDLVRAAKASRLNGGARLLALRTARTTLADAARLFDSVIDKPLTPDKLAAAMQRRTSSAAPPR